MKNLKTLKLALSAVCLALCMILPFLTAQVPEIGNMLCPMHIPVFLCGFVCGPAWALVVGLVAPLLRFALFGMPVLFPMGVSMAVELAVYGLVCGVLYRRLPKGKAGIYGALLAAMVLGRVAWGVMRAILSGLTASAFTWAAFVSGAFTTAVPGIILHLILIPVIVTAIERAFPRLAR